MPCIPSPLPHAALLQAYRSHGDFVDCYRAAVDDTVTLAAFIEAFYTTRLFKAERALLGWLAGQAMGWAFHALLGFHRLYARLLLAAARSQLAQPRS